MVFMSFRRASKHSTIFLCTQPCCSEQRTNTKLVFFYESSRTSNKHKPVLFYTTHACRSKQPVNMTLSSFALSHVAPYSEQTQSLCSSMRVHIASNTKQTRACPLLYYACMSLRTAGKKTLFFWTKSCCSEQRTNTKLVFYYARSCRLGHRLLLCYACMSLRTANKEYLLLRSIMLFRTANEHKAYLLLSAFMSLRTPNKYELASSI